MWPTLNKNPRYEVIKKLCRLVQNHRLPADLDWVEVYYFWAQHQKPPVITPRPTPNRHRFYTRAATNNARAKKLGAAGVVSPEELEGVWEKGGGRCATCNTDQLIVFDHVIPFYRGGEHSPANLQLLCRQHNMEKGVGIPH